MSTQPNNPKPLPPEVNADPVLAQKQAHTWREDVIRQENVIAELKRQLAVKTSTDELVKKYVNNGGLL